jgi:hypothetical protein
LIKEDDVYGSERKNSFGCNEKGRKTYEAWRYRLKVEMDKAEVSRIIDNLKKEGKVISPKRCFYEPV